MTTISVDKLSSKRINVTIKQNEVATTITGMTVYFQVNEAYNDDTVVMEKTMTISDGANGVAYVILSKTDTDLTPGVYYYHIWLVDGSSVPHSVAKGSFVVGSSIKEPGA